MYDPLGLSIGTTNLVAVRAGQPPVMRRSSLTLFPHRTPQVGATHEHADSSETGLLIDGFVERVGEREPLIAADGSAHRPEVLLADAIDAMMSVTGADATQVAIAVPAHWPAEVVQTLRQASRSHAGLSRLSAPPYLVSDAVAALTALHSDRGVASCGVVALLDFGGGGTSITCADAGSGFRPIDETLRYRRFSGDDIDQAILGYILGGTDRGGSVPAGTTTVSDLAQLIGECRRAKERLSVRTATDLVIDLPGCRTGIALTRAELESLIRDPLDAVVAELDAMLRRNRIDRRDLAAVATVGGGAQIPLITERLSAWHGAPVAASQRPAFVAAVGAVLCAAQAAESSEEATEEATAMAAVVTSAAATAGLTTRGSAVDEPGSVMVDAFAWSQEEVRAGREPVPFAGEPYDNDVVARPHPASPPARRPERRRRPHRTSRLGLGVLVAMVAVAGVAYALTSGSQEKVPAEPAGTVTAPLAPPSSEPPPPAPAASSPTAAPAPSSQAPPPPVKTTDRPSATTTAPQPTKTTTTTTTTIVTTTATPSTTAATTPPPSTTTPEPTPTTPVPTTTEYLRIP